MDHIFEDEERLPPQFRRLPRKLGVRTQPKPGTMQFLQT